MDISLFGTLRKLKLSSASLRLDDDFVDRLNHYYTGIVIVVFTIIVSAKQYVGQPLQCWVPATFTGAMEQYAENFCWVQSTYWLPLDEQFPQTHQRKHLQLNYYQWVPFVLVCQAFMFYMPCVFWRLLNWQSGVNVQSIVRMACDAKNIDSENRFKTIRTVTRHIQDALHNQRESVINPGCFSRCRTGVLRFLCCFCWGKRFGNYLVSLYLFTKLLYLTNSLGQIFMLNHFLGTRNALFGVELLVDLVNGREWTVSGIFPRVTMCDFQIRVLANLQRHTIQCVLMINLFNEKIFIFLWFWIFMTTLVTLVSLFYWMVRLLTGSQRSDFIYKYLRVMHRIRKRDSPELMKSFVNVYLRMDGIFVLRLISQNAGDIITTDIINQLWKDYKSRKTIHIKLCTGEHGEGADAHDVV